MRTKQELANELIDILDKLIEQKHFKYRPFGKKEIGYWKKERIEKGIEIFRKNLNKVGK